MVVHVQNNLNITNVAVKIKVKKAVKKDGLVAKSQPTMKAVHGGIPVVKWIWVSFGKSLPCNVEKNRKRSREERHHS